MQGVGQAQRRQAGGVEYTLTRKKVKNINLRIAPDGTAAASAHPRVPAARVDEFVAAHAGWVRSQQQALAARRAAAQGAPQPSRQQALQLFQQVSAQVYPLFRQVLGSEPPQLAVRQMRSRWGVCCPAKRRITLALGLAAVPLPLVQYVVLHEYCHFVYPNHQKEFWALVERYMPDAKARRKALRQYPCGPAAGGGDAQDA